MTMKVLLLALLPFIIAWVVIIAVRDTLASRALAAHGDNHKIADSGRFDPTEALHGIL